MRGVFDGWAFREDGEERRKRQSKKKIRYDNEKYNGKEEKGKENDLKTETGKEREREKQKNESISQTINE